MAVIGRVTLDLARAGLHPPGDLRPPRLAQPRPRRAGTARPPPGRARGTRREIACIKWAAARKTGWETSEILPLSQRTVEDDLRNAARKLGAVDRGQLVAQAMRAGPIA